MNLLAVTLTLLTLTYSSAFTSFVDRAFALIRNQQWFDAATELDLASVNDPVLYVTNNLPYLRGRLAENENDWTHALTEFSRIPPGSPLRPLAAWHQARAAIHLGNEMAATDLLRELPPDFSAVLKMQIAREGSPDFALAVYTTLSTREARFQYAKARNDRNALWALIRERKDDDPALDAAHILGPAVSSSKEAVEVAEVFVVHREFDYALSLYEKAAQDTASNAESRFQIARIYFLRENYPHALERFQALAKDYAGSDSEKDSIYQIASCYWRLGDFHNAQKTYLKYMERYGRDESAVRNLIDVYRALGDSQNALLWTDHALAMHLTAANRQAFIFTKAKILYTQKHYPAALQLFRQLGRGTIRSAPGGTSKDEVRYFEALCLSKTGQTAGAKAIWQELADEPLSYYGSKAAEKLGTPRSDNMASVCPSGKDNVLTQAEDDLLGLRRPIRNDTASPSSDAVSELMFLELWDEASTLLDGNVKRGDYRTAAELAYAAGRFHRSIAYADRMPKSDGNTIALQYPAGFRQFICQAAGKYNIDPLWLHAIIWQESKYNPAAHSGAAARGLMQFIPETANAVGSTIGLAELSPERLYDPKTSIELGARYWASLLDEFKTPEMALAAYNGGPDNVRRWKSKSPATNDDMFVADIGFVETKRYVMAVYSAWTAYRTLSHQH